MDLCINCNTKLSKNSFRDYDCDNCNLTISIYSHDNIYIIKEVVDGILVSWRLTGNKIICKCILIKDNEEIVKEMPILPFSIDEKKLEKLLLLL